MSQAPIKSVRRVFEILELFDQERRPLAAKEIAARLDYPLVSAHALLKSMYQLGYMDLGDRKWSYTPARRFIQRLEWTLDSLSEETTLLDFAEALNRQTRETVNLSRRTDNHVRIVHGQEAIQTIGVSVKPGTEMPLTHSLTGLTAVAAFEGHDIGEFLERLEEHDPDQLTRFDRGQYLSILSELEKTGAVCRTDVFIDGIGALCVPLRSQRSNVLYIVGIVGPSDRIRRQERQHRQSLRRLVREFGVRPLWRVTMPKRT